MAFNFHCDFFLSLASTDGEPVSANENCSGERFCLKRASLSEFLSCVGNGYSEDERRGKVMYYANIQAKVQNLNARNLSPNCWNLL